jgi:hypothetical protein
LTSRIGDHGADKALSTPDFGRPLEEMIVMLDLDIGPLPA